MPTDIDLAQLDSLLAGGAQLVEVLPAVEYDEEHLPGAINIPLKTLGRDGVGSGPAGGRVLLGLALRHEPAGCVAARTSGFR